MNREGGSDVPRRPLLFSSLLLGLGTAWTGCVEKPPFMTERDATVAKMIAAMAVKPTGDADSDFVAMMIPHHQGAIDVAQIELRYGRNEQLRRMAQEIIITQQQEIIAMRMAIGQP